MRSTDVRPAAINASTVFAITLAIIAGLIVAWVFKTVFLAPKPKTVAAAPPTYRVTVMALNAAENTRIQPIQVKRVTVTEEKYKEYKAREKDRGEMLTGNQPVNRVVRTPLLAEEPIYTNDLLPLHYPEPVSKLLEPGKVASIVEVPSRNTMVQVNDRVDLLCTITNTNPQLGPVETRTAVMAKNVKVVARFNTTRDAPTAPTGRTRPYTLEVTPYRYGLIELAKAIGGVFALRIHDRAETGSASATTVASAEEEEDPVKDVVSTEDLAKLFGFSQPLAPKYFEVESFNGVQQVPGRHIYQQPGQGGATTPALPKPGVKPGTPGGVPGTLPGGIKPGNLPGGAIPGGRLTSADGGSAGGSSSLSASASGSSSSSNGSTGWQRLSLTPNAAAAALASGVSSGSSSGWQRVALDPKASASLAGGRGLGSLSAASGKASGLGTPAAFASLGLGKAPGCRT